MGGLFWEERDNLNDAKIKKLSENGWYNISPGEWKDLRPNGYGVLNLNKAYKALTSDLNRAKIPIEPFWLESTYLPFLQDAKEFDPDLMSDEELINLTKVNIKPTLICDIECYSNYVLVAFKSIENEKIIYFESINEFDLNYQKLIWILQNFRIITFNGIHYDLPIIAILLAKKSLKIAHSASVDIIENKISWYKVLRKHKVRPFFIDHIDIKELCIGNHSLKIYAGRIGAKRMQDLPINPAAKLTENQACITKYYCINSDLPSTKKVFDTIQVEIDLRIHMTEKYKIDLRSKSDAQIAEAVICSEVEKLTGRQCEKNIVNPNHIFKYNAPKYINFKSKLLNETLEKIKNMHFKFKQPEDGKEFSGKLQVPSELKELKLNINESNYTIQIGGLHSKEKSASHFSDDNFEIGEADVTSYYPFIIINNEWFPEKLGLAFLKVYSQQIETRLDAKRKFAESKLDKYKKIANSLKILINGGFGKLGEKDSIFYSPDLLLQVTLTGQLTLLMLIEKLENAGIQVVSANTDGVVIKCPKEKIKEKEKIFKQWEKETNLNLEWTPYKALYSRDVNNYIALKEDGQSFKTKGAYAKSGLSKNPTSQICIEAACEYLKSKKSIKKHIMQCKDILKFLTLRNVKGGAVKDDEYIGKSIRWYYSKNNYSHIVCAKNGNRVPESFGAKSIMDIPNEFPKDINYSWYVRKSEEILEKIGAN